MDVQGFFFLDHGRAFGTCRSCEEEYRKKALDKINLINYHVNKYSHTTMKLIISQEQKHTILPNIMRAAIHLFAKNGIDGTTIEEIAKKADVAEGALYRHFKSKDDLAWHLFSTHLGQFTSDLMGKVLSARKLDDRMQRFVLECFTAFDADRDLFVFLILSEHREFKKYPLTSMHPGRLAVKMVEDAQKTGEIGAGEPFLLGGLVIGAIIRACVVHMYGRIPGKLTRYHKQVANALVQMLKGFK